MRTFSAKGDSGVVVQDDVGHERNALMLAA